MEKVNLFTNDLEHFQKSLKDIIEPLSLNHILGVSSPKEAKQIQLNGLAAPMNIGF